MDNTFLIEVTDVKAIEMLQEMQEHQLIRVIKENVPKKKQSYRINIVELLLKNKGKNYKDT